MSTTDGERIQVIVAIFSDIHANLPALEKFVKSTKYVATEYICLGDIVNYGPWNDECLELIFSLPNVTVLEGNHEKLFTGLTRIENEQPLVQEFYLHSVKHFSRIDLISKLPTSYGIGDFICKHTINDKKIYKNTEISISENYFIGHTHYQYKIKQMNNSIINCGSIGQSRECSKVLNYALYDLSSGKIKLCEEPYPLDRFLNELSARGYSRMCLDYYSSKLR